MLALPDSGGVVILIQHLDHCLEAPARAAAAPSFNQQPMGSRLLPVQPPQLQQSQRVRGSAVAHLEKQTFPLCPQGRPEPAAVRSSCPKCQSFPSGSHVAGEWKVLLAGLSSLKRTNSPREAGSEVVHLSNGDFHLHNHPSRRDRCGTPSAHSPGAWR